MRPACLSRLSAPARAIGVISLAFGLGACAAQEDSVEKQLSKLHDDITRLQAETDRMSERMEALELRGTASARSEERVASSAPPTTVSRPKLKVVRVEPDGEPTAADASDPGTEGDSAPRLLIQGEGKTLESRTLPGSQKTAPKPASGTTPSKSAPSTK
ncbi:MAG TPA: hypothetical protein VGK73_28475 [Polyangiaceae bacterium]